MVDIVSGPDVICIWQGGITPLISSWLSLSVLAAFLNAVVKHLSGSDLQEERLLPGSEMLQLSVWPAGGVAGARLRAVAAEL